MVAVSLMRLKIRRFIQNEEQKLRRRILPNYGFRFLMHCSTQIVYLVEEKLKKLIMIKHCRFELPAAGLVEPQIAVTSLAHLQQADIDLVKCFYVILGPNILPEVNK